MSNYGLEDRKYTVQELFDKALVHVWRQGPALRDGAKNCVMRTKDGKACAFGCLMPDHLVEKFADTASSEDMLTCGEVKEYLRHRSVLEYRPVLREIQTAHDTAAHTNFCGVTPIEIFREEFLKCMEIIAVKYNLIHEA